MTENSEPATSVNDSAISDSQPQMPPADKAWLEGKTYAATFRLNSGKTPVLVTAVDRSGNDVPGLRRRRTEGRT